MLGVEVPPARVTQILHTLEIAAHPELPAAGRGPLVHPPPFRPDLTREIDLIEEVARVTGSTSCPPREKIAARVAAPQTSERAMTELARVLTGLGFYETVTFTLRQRQGRQALRSQRPRHHRRVR